MYEQLLVEVSMLRAGLGFEELHLTAETPVWAVLLELDEMSRTLSGRKKSAVRQLHRNISATIK